MKLIRPNVARLKPYVPGEQPKIKGLVKLNTNENPYPPSPKVLMAVKAAVDGRLRLYPNPTASLLRQKLARLHRCQPENIIIGNGSDELLALATRCFVEPQTCPSVAAKSSSDQVVQFLAPCYSLYPVLAEIHGARINEVPLRPDYSIPSVKELRQGGKWDFNAALTFLTTPNAPSGRGYRTAELNPLCEAQRGVVILDEAYVDFARENALKLALEHPHVLVSRTFSKAYSLCFQRVGYFVGSPQLIQALDKIRDSYNVNGLGQIAALATLDNLPYYRTNFKRIIATRRRLSQDLETLGFEVFPSETNFILVRPPAFPARDWLDRLRVEKLLVRWFSHASLQGCLRISIGSDQETDKLILGIRKILNRTSRMKAMAPPQ